MSMAGLAVRFGQRDVAEVMLVVSSLGIERPCMLPLRCLDPCHCHDSHPGHPAGGRATMWNKVEGSQPGPARTIQPAADLAVGLG